MADISLTFPDGAVRRFPAGITPAEVAAAIAPSLARAAISAQVDGAHWDLAWPISADARLAINTMKDEVFIASPAVVGGDLYLRSQKAIYCIRAPK